VHHVRDDVLRIENSRVLTAVQSKKRFSDEITMRHELNNCLLRVPTYIESSPCETIVTHIYYIIMSCDNKTVEFCVKKRQNSKTIYNIIIYYTGRVYLVYVGCR